MPPALLARRSLAVIGALLSFSALADLADDDLRRAAKLHKAGDTVQAVAIWES